MENLEKILETTLLWTGILFFTGGIALAIKRNILDEVYGKTEPLDKKYNLSKNSKTDYNNK